MNVRKYRYFVSYNCNSYAGSGSGWVEVFRDSPIRARAERAAVEGRPAGSTNGRL